MFEGYKEFSAQVAVVEAELIGRCVLPIEDRPGYGRGMLTNRLIRMQVYVFAYEDQYADIVACPVKDNPDTTWGALAERLIPPLRPSKRYAVREQKKQPLWVFID